jgi:altronate hydrolase
MKELTKDTAGKNIYPERIIQFGEGNFLRAFADWMIQLMNDRIHFNSSAVVVQPIEKGWAERLNSQDCLYHVNLQGMEKGEKVNSLTRIESVSRALNPYTQFDEYMRLAELPQMRFVISNTTEAGIVFDPACRLSDRPASSFPGKLTQLLYRRYQTFGGDRSKGLIIFPCELIAQNGLRLKETILQYAERWKLEAGFAEWFGQACGVYATLVDRIVPGFPYKEIDAIREKTGFDDRLAVLAEPFHLWVIEAPQAVAREFPADKAGLNVVFVSDEKPYRRRKVTLLNGTHTLLAPVAYLAGIDFVRDACQHEATGRYVRSVLFGELMETVENLSQEELTAFAGQTLERFDNPFIDHAVVSIMLNSFAKFEARNLPALKTCLRQKGQLPKGIVCGLAALLTCYNGQTRDCGATFQPGDSPQILNLLRNLWATGSVDRVARGVLADVSVWNEDLNQLPGLTAMLTDCLAAIREKGMLCLIEKEYPARKYIRINPADNVAVALENLAKGDSLYVDETTLVVQEDIPAGHKIALQDFGAGRHVVKYGYPIGHAVCPVTAGFRIDERNVRTNLQGLQDYVYAPQPIPPAPGKEDISFRGYRRKNGDAGVRNELWIVPTAGCVNGIAQELANRLRLETNEAGVDAIVAIPHTGGCSQLGDDHENTRNILRNLVLHPNAGGVLVVALGCENNQLHAFRRLLGEFDAERIRFIETQEAGDELETGMRLLRELYSLAANDKRTDVSLQELRVGLKCGASDGFSGITANPLLGAFSDFLTAQGGTVVLTETPEMFGAETILMNRCESKEVFRKTVCLINDFKSYFIQNNQPVYENPSPGNKAGGISTLEEKSLGCTFKAGASAVRDVLPYAARLRANGLNLLNAPGNDPVACTALAAAGCHIILFTTGRGTPFGTVVPTVKIATNSDLFIRKPNWIDFNAGTLLEDETMESAGNRFVRFIVDTASGALTNNEKNKYREIALFKTGVTL